MIQHHTDVVGSLLRPKGLLRARKARESGRLSEPVFKRLEDRAVLHAIRLQEAAGLQVVTDGEMRRLSFQSQMTEAVMGFGPCDIHAFVWGDWKGEAATEALSVERPENLGVVARLVRKRYLSVEEFRYLHAHTRRLPKVTLPSPSLWCNFWSRARSSHVYPTLDSFLSDIVGILRDEVLELVRCGARYIQIDAPHYPLLLDPATRRFYEAQGWSLDHWLERGIEMDNALMAELPDVTFGFHL
jgi:5-methyltetrahydropteroyltriglutamate--homocysteine methyltransferase